MLAHNINEIAQIISGKIIGNKSLISNFSVECLSIDSRTLAKYENCLFIAIKGIRNNGHNYISSLYKKGVKCFIISDSINTLNYPEAVFIKVNNCLDALQQLAANSREKYNYPVVAITGSNGKTIVKEWLYNILHHSIKIVRSPKSYNSQVGVPLSVLNLNKNYDLAIIEAGISEVGEMEKLENIIKPTVGIFTNIGEAHQVNFINIKQKIQEKIKLFKNAETIIYCKEHNELANELEKTFNKKQLFSWSINNNLSSDLQITSKSEPQRTIITGKWEEKTYTVDIPFTEQASIENALHCLAFIIRFGYFNTEVAKNFGFLQPIAMRMELKEGINNCLLINDYYNSDIHSLEIALQLQANNTSTSKKTKCLILSDIEQTEFTEKKLAKYLNKMLEPYKIEKLILIGEKLANNASIFDGNVSFYKTTNDFLNKFSAKEFSNHVILIKGARNFQFERIASVLQKKYHQTRLEINLSSMIENLNKYRKMLKPETKIMIMVKALSYGTGTVEVAKILEFQKVDYLAVAVADEGIELRQAGINVPIIVMNPEYHSFETMIENRLEPNIYSLQLYTSFQELAKKMAVQNFPIHIKLETGMHRLGFDNENELHKLANSVDKDKTLNVVSIFSHLAASDMPSEDAFTNSQFAKFNILSQIILKTQPTAIRHILNSAGIERFSKHQMEMVRLGIGLYGYAQSKNMHCDTVVRWITTISQVKIVNAGNSIGYGRQGIANTEKKIAIIPVGYADGYNRKLSNGVGKVWINNCKYPIIGNICMDMCMIDITDSDIDVGTEVELMGEHIKMKNIADWIDTIPYEILTSISQRVRRIYIQE